MNMKRSRQGRSLSAVFVLVISLILPLALGTTTGSGLAAEYDGPPYQGEPMTPFQTELATAISQRQASGLPFQTVTFSTQSGDLQSFGALSPPQMQAMTGKTNTVTARTIIYFNGLQEAGYAEWPATEIKGNLAGDDTTNFSTGDLNEVIRNGMEEQVPGFWQQVDFGQEPRKYSITETYEFSPPSEESRLAQSLPYSPQATTDGDILMGFTYTGEHLKHLIEYEVEACIPWTNICGQLFYLKAGFELDWALGLRLPASVTLTGPDQVEQGSEAYFQTSLTPQNWDASKYSGYGVAPENGNEFALRFTFFAGILIKVVGEEVCPPGFICHLDFNVDKSASFTTPFGADSFFPIPPIEIPLYELKTGIFNFNASLTITPLLTSTQIKADWQTVSGSDCSGSGTVTYSEPNTPVTFGPVSVCNYDKDPGTNQAQVELKNFRYYFNSFKIQLGAKVYVNVFSVYEKTKEATIFTLDLSKIFSSLGLAVGDHVRCTWDFKCSRVGPANLLTLTIPTKDETPPVTSITLPPIDGANGWYVSDVQFSLNAADECGSGVDMTEYSFDNTTWYLYTAPVLLDDDGIYIVYFRSKDINANLEAAKSQTIQIDQTPPVITGAPTIPANGFGWWNTDVVVHFEATDAVSGIDFVTPDVTISSEGENQSVVGTAIDMAGNEAQVTVGDINIDKTLPVVTITSPLPQTFVNTDSFIILWTAVDFLSGINTSSGDLDGTPVDNGQLVELLLLAAGEHTITVAAVDKADNVATASVDFFIQVDINGLIASVKYMCENGLINSPGICNSLLAKLNNAKNAIDRGQCSVAENILTAFINEVEALSGIGLTEEANVLKADALYVIETLVCASSSPLTGGLQIIP